MATARANPELSNLLSELFDAEDLHRFVDGFDAGHALSNELPRNASSKDLAYAATKMLRRHGLVDAHFFQALLRERPMRAAAIQALMRELGIERGTPRVTIDVVLDGNLEDLTAADLDQFVQHVKGLVGDPTVQLKGKRDGSIVVELELTEVSARLLKDRQPSRECM